jgi:2-dehydropantoate 2-reductase
VRICVYGAGAIGGHIAVRLAQAGESVSVVARGAHLEAIRDRGLKLLSGKEVIEARVAASDDPRELGPQDLVFVTVKAPSLPSLDLPCLLEATTPVVFALNGIPWWYRAELRPQENKVTDPERVIGCVLYGFDEIVAPGVIRNLGPGSYVLGEPNGEVTARCKNLKGLLAKAKLEAPVTTQIRSEIWNKLLLNIANGAICCLTRCDLQVLTRNAELRALALRLMHEARAVAVAHGVTGLGEPEKMLPRELPAHKPSILKDLEAGRPLEIDAIYYAVLDFARAAGVATPLLDALVPLLSCAAGARLRSS